MNTQKEDDIEVPLLRKETIDSYECLLKDFLRAHHGKDPKIILTDQDVTIIKVVEFVFLNSRHRLCM